MGRCGWCPSSRTANGRTVAELYADGTYLNAAMVRAGMAWRYERYSDDCPNRSVIVSAEGAARSQSVGVFVGEHQPPWA